MNTPESTTHDYRKWLLYSFDNQDFETYYNLFKALKSGSGSGTITITQSEKDGIRTYVISQGNAGVEALEITEDQRKAFLTYLTENYFRTEDVDKLAIEKRQNFEKTKNHNYIESRNTEFDDPKATYKVKPHSKETLYFNIKFVISLSVYLFLMGYLVYGILSDPSALVVIGFFIAGFLIASLFSKILHGIFVGIIRGNSIRVTKEQFPDVYEIIKEQARQLNLKDLPEIYITYGHFNAFVTRFSRAHILLIYSEVIETALKGNYDVLKYVTAHELCHIKQKHLLKHKYLAPSSLIPFLDLAYSRGCEFTCDRAGYYFSPKGSIEGVLIMTTGKEIYSNSNIESHIKNSIENEGFWTWLSEKFLTHPHLYKRLIEIKDYSKYN